MATKKSSSKIKWKKIKLIRGNMVKTTNPWIAKYPHFINIDDGWGGGGGFK